MIGAPASTRDDKAIVAKLDVVTAPLWAKGTNDGEPFDYKLWFSDTYVRPTAGWRYVLGQVWVPDILAPDFRIFWPLHGAESGGWSQHL
jgi:hypothetical protein